MTFDLAGDLLFLITTTITLIVEANAMAKKKLSPSTKETQIAGETTDQMLPESEEKVLESPRETKSTQQMVSFRSVSLSLFDFVGKTAIVMAAFLALLFCVGVA